MLNLLDLTAVVCNLSSHTFTFGAAIFNSFAQKVSYKELIAGRCSYASRNISRCSSCCLRFSDKVATVYQNMRTGFVSVCVHKYLFVIVGCAALCEMRLCS